MSYHGLIPLVKQHLHASVPQDRAPAICEIGVDRGVTFLSLVVFLARTRHTFLALGVDVMVQEQVQLMLSNIDLQPDQRAFLMQGNSLDVMPKMVDQGLKFDVLLIDGDHNYHTVQQELRLVEALTYPHSIVVCDDYVGRWAERDLYYSEREGYENNEHATKRVDTEKHGVKPAIDEWLAAHPAWQMSQPAGGEPVLLMRKVA